MSKLLNIRMATADLEKLQRFADRRHLPISTAARAALLASIQDSAAARPELCREVDALLSLLESDPERAARFRQLILFPGDGLAS